MLRVKEVIPTFFIADLKRSVDWYVRVLGFQVAFRTEGYAGVELGPARIHLAQHAGKFKGACYLRLDEGVDAYVAAIEKKAQPLTASLKDHEYGMREATVRDPDGNDIYIGQPIP